MNCVVWFISNCFIIPLLLSELNCKVPRDSNPYILCLLSDFFGLRVLPAAVLVSSFGCHGSCLQCDIKNVRKVIVVCSSRIRPH